MIDIYKVGDKVICSHCGSRANDTDKFCNNCGSPLTNLNTSSQEFSNQHPQMTPIIPYDFQNQVIGPYPWNVQRNPNLENQYDYSKMKKKKKKGKPFLVVGVFILLVAVTLIWINRDQIFQNYKDKRTIMIYMIGSDLESQYVSASSDIKEMINSKADFEHINLLLYTGGAKKWHNEEIPNDKNTIFKVTSDGLEKLEEYSRKDMGDASTLREFLDYGYDHYKAEKYSLILWDHGGGPIYGYGYDEYNKLNSLSLLELESALKSSPFNSEQKLEWIGFDACLMATAEIAYKVSDYAEYMIASQEVEPGDGWDYSFLKNISVDMTTPEIGKEIINSYERYYRRRLSGKGISLSLLKLDQMDYFEEKLNDLFQDMEADLRIDFSRISRVRSNSKTFGKSTSVGYDLIDLYDLLDRLSVKYRNKIDDLKEAIEKLVIYQKTDLVNTNGISIYFPYENKKNINATLYLYEKFDFAEEYTSFIDNFSSTLTGNRLYDWNLESLPLSETQGMVTVNVPKEVAENYNTASYLIFEKIGDYYMPIWKGTDVTLNGNTLSTTLTKKALVARDNEGNKAYVTAIESEKGTDYTKYMIPGVLQKWDDDFLNDFETQPIYLNFMVTEENKDGVIVSASPIVEGENQVSPKLSIDINDWKIIQLLNYKYQVLDESGNYTSNWLSSGEVTGVEMEIKDGVDLEFEDLDSSKEYYCLFRLKDSQGNEYTTNIIKIANE